MVESQIRARGLDDPRLLEALKKVPRHEFVTDQKPASAYGDHPLPIGCDQTISQPYIVAYMTHALGLEGGERILEVGTGSGYQTAILAELAAQVYTVEVKERLSISARTRLDEMGYSNVNYRTGDGRKGWPEEAPFDGMIVTAAPADLPRDLITQVVEGGRLIIPVGQGDQTLMRYVRKDKGFSTESLMAVRFVPLI
jgi:protein-L-isoaspartate(D-aspartate) O-methyltransferase